MCVTIAVYKFVWIGAVSRHSIVTIGRKRERESYKTLLLNNINLWAWRAVFVSSSRAETWTFRADLVRSSLNFHKIVFDGGKTRRNRPPILGGDRRFRLGKPVQEWSLIQNRRTTRTISGPLKAILCKRSCWEYRRLADSSVVRFALSLTQPSNCRVKSPLVTQFWDYICEVVHNVSRDTHLMITIMFNCFRVSRIFIWIDKWIIKHNKRIKTKHYIYNLQNAITNLFEDDLFIYIRGK